MSSAKLQNDSQSQEINVSDESLAENMPIPIQEAEIAFCLLCIAAAQKITHATHSVNCLACHLWYCMVEFFLWLLINSTLLLSLLLLIHVVLGLLIVNCLTSLLLVFFPYAKQISLMVFGSLNRFLFKRDMSFILQKKNACPFQMTTESNLHYSAPSE